MSDEKRDPVQLVAESFCRDGAAEDVCPPTKVRQCPCWGEAQRLLHDVKMHAPALRAAGLLRDEAEIAARERAAREKALREAAAVVCPPSDPTNPFQRRNMAEQMQAAAILALIDGEAAP